MLLVNRAFPGMLMTSEKKKNTLKEFMQHTRRGKMTWLTTIKTRCWPQNIMPAHSEWKLPVQPLWKNRTLETSSFQGRIKGYLFRCPCTPNPSARHCSLSLLNTYTAEVRRDLKQVRTSACKVQNWCIILDSPCLIIFFNFKCLSSH